MGRTKKRESKSDEKQKRKRRKKSRTDVSSDSDSGSSSEDEVQVVKEKGKGKEKEDDVMEDAPVAAEVVPAAREVVDDDDEANEQEQVGRFTEKGGPIPSSLRDLHDPQADSKFDEYYMRLITEEFGDDLNTVREAKDFDDESLPMLIRALRQGVNIFSVGEKRTVVNEIA